MSATRKSMNDHPTVKRFHEMNKAAIARGELPLGERGLQTLDHEWLRRLCLEAGADDVGFARVDQVEEREDVLRFFPHTKALIGFVLRMNREQIRNPARSVRANTLCPINLDFQNPSRRMMGHQVVETAYAAER